LTSYLPFHPEFQEVAMSDRIIDATDARAVNLKARRNNPLVGWVISREDPDYPDKVVARLVTGTPAPHTLVADSLAELRAQLPPGLERSKSQPSDPPHIVEIWFAA
jgi:hypothetical protein